MKLKYFIIIVCLIPFIFSCSEELTGPDETSDNADDNDTTDTNSNNEDSDLLYTSYSDLVMAGYQGWFTAEGDGANRGWYHYQNHSCNGFYTGCSSIDFWPEMEEYEVSYETDFEYENGSPAYVFSSYDYETIDLHFKWMKEYGIDGVFMQRFLNEIQNIPGGEQHFNTVLEHALEAARKYDRAISVMYDLSGSSSDDIDYLLEDWSRLQREFDLLDSDKHPTYVRHNDQPLLGIWGVGFDDGRDYSIADAEDLVSNLNNRFSIMLGVPYFWRTYGRDTLNEELLHSVIRKSDIIMPWAVGRYGPAEYEETATSTLAGDIDWTDQYNIDYVPLAFPGFSWGNLRNDPSIYDHIPRQGGDFFWQQVAGAKNAGANALYVAMFDEMDEGTAIFKLSNENEVPLNADGKFIGIEEEYESDHYLWLTGQAANWFRGDETYNEERPTRN